MSPVIMPLRERTDCCSQLKCYAKSMFRSPCSSCSRFLISSEGRRLCGTRSGSSCDRALTTRSRESICGDPRQIIGRWPRQRGARAVEDRPHGRAHPASAVFAPEPSVPHPPTAGGIAVGTHEAARPAKPLQVVQACRVVRKPRPLRRVVGGIVAANMEVGGRRLHRHPDILPPPHSDG